jgi:IS5 family transposase
LIFLEYYNKLSNEDFKRVTGVSKETFKEMLQVVTKHYLATKSKGGRKKSLSPSDEILVMLEYYREYRTLKHIGIDYGVSESTTHYIVTKIEKLLIKNLKFHLEKLKNSREKNTQEAEVFVLDVTESPCERPKKKQKQYYSGKKKRHTLKSQILTTLEGKILSIKIDKGRIHDFKLFKKSKAAKKIKNNKVLADSGYQGIAKICPNAKIPKKKTKKNSLSKEDKKSNKELARERIIVEQINAKIKVFKITKYPYRNRQKKFGLRMNLICAIINLDLKPINMEINDA